MDNLNLDGINDSEANTNAIPDRSIDSTGGDDVSQYTKNIEKILTGVQNHSFRIDGDSFEPETSNQHVSNDIKTTHSVNSKRHRVKRRRRKFVHVNNRLMRKLMYIWLVLTAALILAVMFYYFITPSNPGYKDLENNQIISEHTVSQSNSTGAINIDDLPNVE